MRIIVRGILYIFWKILFDWNHTCSFVSPSKDKGKFTGRYFSFLFDPFLILAQKLHLRILGSGFLIFFFNQTALLTIMETGVHMCRKLFSPLGWIQYWMSCSPDQGKVSKMLSSISCSAVLCTDCITFTRNHWDIHEYVTFHLSPSLVGLVCFVFSILFASCRISQREQISSINPSVLKLPAASHNRLYITF